MYQRVVVTVKRKDEARVRDLEVPVNLTAERLAEMIARALRWETDMAGQRITYLIEAHPLGRMLQPDETLAGAGVWDGSWLVLHPMQAMSQAPEVGAPPNEAQRPTPAQPQPVTQAPVTPTPPVPAPPPVPMPAVQEEAWTFPATPVQPSTPEPVVAQPEAADSSALLEMLLGGTAAPPPPTPVEEEKPAPAAPTPVEQVPPPVPTFQAAEQPAPEPEPQPWTFPMVTAPLPVEPEPTTTPSAGDMAAQAQAPQQPAENNSLLEMLLGGQPTQQAAPPVTPEAAQPQPEAPSTSWPYPAEPEPERPGTNDDIWTFPVASSAEVQAVQPPAKEEEEEEAQPAPAPFDAWAFPITPEQPTDMTSGQATQTPEPTSQPQEGGSLLEMLLGGAPAEAPVAPTQPAAPPEPAPATPPVFEGQPPVVAPPEPQPDTTQAAASAQPEKPDKGKGKPLTEPKVGGFRPLGIELPPDTEPPPDEKKPRFVWKKLDE